MQLVRIGEPDVKRYLGAFLLGNLTGAVWGFLGGIGFVEWLLTMGGRRV